ncbi:MAG TPA: di-heme oxidoredictase family protein [Candidatus Acidoferrales bacterium]|nr:di-heme oxidoredictase family protein [Candidatus Acidoferrales bacterium]
MYSCFQRMTTGKLLTLLAAVLPLAAQVNTSIGQEVAIPRHLTDGEELQMRIPDLIAFGRQLFKARWTVQEGQGRPKIKGTGNPLSDPSSPLLFPRSFNRLSGPDSNSCSGCHNLPFDGGGGDRVTNVFVLGQRFDFLDFDRSNVTPTRGIADERGAIDIMATAFNERKTIGMNGSGFIEMLARQMTADFQAQRDATPAGRSVNLTSKGISFGTLTHNADGSWDVSRVAGLAAPSLATSGTAAPSLLLRPFHQAGNVVSVRQFTNNAFPQHHGMQPEERVGLGVDGDGDGVVNELTTADITAITLFQVTLNVPGQVIPRDPQIQAAIAAGQQLFGHIGCASCHVPALPLTNNGWMFTEPGPYNPATGANAPNLLPGPAKYPVTAPPITVDLTSDALPRPRLKPVNGVVMVPAYTDLKLHTLCDGPTDPNAEPLDQNQPAGSTAFFAGNMQFLTRKLWGLYNSGPFGHAGSFTTMREAITLGHNGEGKTSRLAFQALSPFQQDEVIEFLKSLQVLPSGTPCLVVNDAGRCVGAGPRQDSEQ